MIRLLLAALLMLALPTAAMAQNDALSAQDPLAAAAVRRAKQVLQVIQGSAKPEDVFAPSFLQAVPASQLQAVIKQLTDANGAAQAVENLAYKGNGGAALTIRFEKARVEAAMQLSADAPYLVTGFRITGGEPIGDSPAKIVAEIEALHGRASIGAYALDPGGPRPIFESRAAGEQFAIGSACKLYVLSALARQIEAGTRHWDDVVQLGQVSLPSGQMQAWPTGSPVTLHTLATMMVSISDNTATDTLIRLVGQDPIHAELVASGHSEPGRDTPFLTTIQSFAIKSDPAKVAEYAAADSKGRQALLAKWATLLYTNHVDPSRFSATKPNAIDTIEWFASNADIARIFQRLHDGGGWSALNILEVNKALPDAIASRWAYVGYKGGSETGVLNLSWLLQDQQGHWFAVSESWNDTTAPVDENQFVALGIRAIGMLARE
jgi:beta-lactamase class A